MRQRNNKIKLIIIITIIIIIIIIIIVPYYDSRLKWVHDTAPPPSRRLEQTDTVPRSDPSENSRNSVPRNILDPFPVLLMVTIPVLLVVTHPVLLVVTHPVLLVVTFLVLLHKHNSSAFRPGNSVYSPSQRGSPLKNSENKMSGHCHTRLASSSSLSSSSQKV